MKSATSMGISSTTIQAPWLNLVTAITSITRPVVAAPTALRPQRHRQPGSRRVSQRRTMLACESVKERNTPTA